jgi:hypothetical protein
MSLRGMKLILQVAFCTILMAGSASAVTVVPTEGPNAGAAINLVNGQSYTYSTGSLAVGAIGAAPPAGLFLNFFVPTAPLGTVTISAEGLLSKIANLTLTWLDASQTAIPGGVLQVTNASGNPTGASLLALVLANSSNYFLQITGNVLQSDATFEIAITATPIPPALLLFGSALAGLGFLGRRSNRKVTSPLA